MRQQHEGILNVTKSPLPLPNSKKSLGVTGWSTCANYHTAFLENSWEGMEGQKKAIDSIYEQAHI